MNAVSNQRTCHLQMVAGATAAPPSCHYLWTDLLNNSEISQKANLELNMFAKGFKYISAKLFAILMEKTVHLTVIHFFILGVISLNNSFAQVMVTSNLRTLLF